MKVLSFLKVFSPKHKYFTALQYRTIANNPLLSHWLLRTFDRHSKNVAIVDNAGSYKYSYILSYSYYLAQKMRETTPSLMSDGQKTVSFLCSNDVSYVCTLLACWINGSIAVPLCKEHPSSLLEYFINDSMSSLTVCTSPFIDQIKPLSEKLNVPLLMTEHPSNASVYVESMNCVPAVEFSDKISGMENNGAVIIYTSGTTGPPKGVLLTHNNLNVQVRDIVNAWNGASSDVMLNVLPLHHVHGFLYCLLCPIAVGATVVMMPKFDAIEVWKHFLHLNDCQAKVNMFSAVPTVYTKLIHNYDELCTISSLKKDEIKNRCTKNVRLMVSGSSALPDSVFHTWENLTGHVILERYGMSEIGMALSNPLIGNRVPGSVGTALSTVQVRIAKPSSSDEYEILVESVDGKTTVAKGREAEPGDLHIKGLNVFAKYWQKPKATSESFTKDGWFKTGDVAIYENGMYRILGRASSDIIKTGGYKVSALDVERHLLEHPAVSECTVFGLPDDVWGEVVSAVVALYSEKAATTPDLKEFCKMRLPPYSVPKVFKFMQAIPRNVTGKVNKKELREELKTELQQMLKNN